jgi:hypothetical protein
MKRKKHQSIKTYFACDSRGFIKIGIARSIFHRLAELQTGNPLRLRVLAVFEGDHEQRLHEKFRHLRASGEWFKAGPEIWEEVLAYKKTQPQQTNPEVEQEVESLSDAQWFRLTDCVESLLQLGKSSCKKKAA